MRRVRRSRRILWHVLGILAGVVGVYAVICEYPGFAVLNLMASLFFLIMADELPN